MLESQQPDLAVIETGIWDHFFLPKNYDAQFFTRPDETADGWVDPQEQIRDWIATLRRDYRGPIVFSQPPDAQREFDRLVRGLGLPLLWRRPSFEHAPDGFPDPTAGRTHPSDVIALEHVNMLLSATCE